MNQRQARRVRTQCPHCGNQFDISIQTPTQQDLADCGVVFCCEGCEARLAPSKADVDAGYLYCPQCGRLGQLK